MGKNGDLSIFERSMVVGVKTADLSSSENADLLRISPQNHPRGLKRLVQKNRNYPMTSRRKYLADGRGQRRRLKPVCFELIGR